jgi:hypothetical protein
MESLIKLFLAVNGAFGVLGKPGSAPWQSCVSVD